MAGTAATAALWPFAATYLPQLTALRHLAIRRGKGWLQPHLPAVVAAALRDAASAQPASGEVACSTGVLCTFAICVFEYNVWAVARQSEGIALRS